MLSAFLRRALPLLVLGGLVVSSCTVHNHDYGRRDGGRDRWHDHDRHHRDYGYRR